MRLATFNVQNLRLRQRDGQLRLDAARDGDVDYGICPPSLAEADRHLTAQLLHAANPDVVALQEVFDQQTLDYFHDEFLIPAGAAPYPVRHCLPGNDGRGLNVALLSRFAPGRVKSHSGETGRTLGLTGLPANFKDTPIFRRDCLEVQFASVTLYICHFKAPYPDASRAFAARHAESRAVRCLIERRFSNPMEENWIIAGDFNEPNLATQNSAESALAPLLDNFAIDLAARQAARPDWTFETPDRRFHSRPDRILVSSQLAARCPDARLEVVHAPGPVHQSRIAEPHPSDHALVIADFPGL